MAIDNPLQPAADSSGKGTDDQTSAQPAADSSGDMIQAVEITDDQTSAQPTANSSGDVVPASKVTEQGQDDQPSENQVQSLTEPISSNNITPANFNGV